MTILRIQNTVFKAVTGRIERPETREQQTIMGRIVGGFATSHVLFPPKGVEAQAECVFQGMMAMRAAVKALAPDVLVVASSDHMNNFTLAKQIGLAVGIADEYVPLGDMRLPQTPMKGCRRLGEAFAREAADFGLVAVEEVHPDHGIMITKLIADPDPQLPIVPVFINTNMPIPPSPARAYALGSALKACVDALGDCGRVVVIAGGGLSHWLCTPEEGRVNADFDRRFMERLVAGRADELAHMRVDELEAAAGNGGLELASWLFVAGAMPKARGEILYYEAMPEWITGMGGVALHA